MIQPGLVSVTFRQLSPREVTALVSKAGLASIEWGGDIHVPHGDVKRAGEVRYMTHEAGLTVAAYGSYYRVGPEEKGAFEAVLDTAVALGAPTIRVWAGVQGSAQADDAYWGRVVDDTRRIANLATPAGITITYEFHANTLTDTHDSARKLLETVGHPNVKAYWQPPRYSSLDDNLAGLEAVFPWLHNIHVFNWHITTGERLPLADGADVWSHYLEKVTTTGRRHFALLEFVKDDDPENFLQDAATLKAWLAKTSNL